MVCRSLPPSLPVTRLLCLYHLSLRTLWMKINWPFPYWLVIHVWNVDKTVSASHCCIVVHINVIQHQNIFFSWMNRPSDHSSQRIIPVQFWELLHTFKQFLWKNIYLFFFRNFLQAVKHNKDYWVVSHKDCNNEWMNLF